MHGRRLLVFSDSRQDAAFFAPFFRADLAIRPSDAAAVRTVREDAEEDDEPLRVRAICMLVYGKRLRADSPRCFSPTGRNRRTARISRGGERTAWLAHGGIHLAAGAATVPLESLGLIRTDYDAQRCERLARRLAAVAPRRSAMDAEIPLRLLLDADQRNRLIRRYCQVKARPRRRLDLGRRARSAGGRWCSSDLRRRVTTGLLPASDRHNRLS